MVMTMRGISSIRKTEIITAAIAETRCKSRIFGFWRILINVKCCFLENCMVLVSIPSVSFGYFQFSICHSFSLFLCLSHATNQLSVETDQDDTRDKVNEDNAEPEKKLCNSPQFALDYENVCCMSHLPKENREVNIL